MFPLTHDEEVVLLLHGLVDDLGGDLAGVVARHVRVHLPQHHALRVATPALQQHQGNGPLSDHYDDFFSTYIEVQLWQREKLFLVWIVAGLVAVELVGALVPLDRLQSLALHSIGLGANSSILTSVPSGSY